MRKVRLRLRDLGLLTILVLGAVLTFNGSGAFAANGANGDVKIHAVGTSTTDEQNEPHVCLFYLEGFNFDSTDTGNWFIQSWPPTGDGSVVKSGSWSGSNFTTDPISLPDGHYKLSWVVTHHTGEGTTVETEKHKVFWVDCEKPPSPSPSPSPTPTPTLTPTPTPTPTPSGSPTPTPSPSGSPTPSPSPSGLPSPSPSGSPSPSPTPKPSGSPSPTPSSSASPTPTPTAVSTPTSTPTATPTGEIGAPETGTPGNPSAGLSLVAGAILLLLGLVMLVRRINQALVRSEKP